MGSIRDRKEYKEMHDHIVNDAVELTNGERKVLKTINNKWLAWIAGIIFAAGGFYMSQKMQVEYTDKRVDCVEIQQKSLADEVKGVSLTVAKIDERTKMILERLPR